MLFGKLAGGAPMCWWPDEAGKKMCERPLASKIIACWRQRQQASPTGMAGEQLRYDGDIRHRCELRKGKSANLGSEDDTVHCCAGR
jgi:hypothetical protein